MSKIKVILSLCIAVFLCASCGVTYKKEEISQDLQALIKKECGLDSNVVVIGKTLYLDIVIDKFISNDNKIVFQTIKTIQTTNLAIVRVVLSSDSNIQYMVGTAFDKNKILAFRIVQNIDDIKSYFYMRISRSDYESRNLIELAGGSSFAARMVNDKHDITKDEFVGRLIASQINMMIRTNLLYGALIGAMQMQYIGIKGNELYFLVLGTVNSVVEPIIQEALQSDLESYVNKYQVSFNSIKAINQNGKVIFNAYLS
ncbi:MAG: hypothetical protein LBI80_01595 [Endomicrobium sp.]|jgi:hypothetical protein|nr:hypothetical protein [Endomicrobium sp.]